MLMPSIFGENLFDDWFDEFPFYDMDKEMNNTEKKLYGKKAGRIMKTDIKEQKDGYELMIDLPGFTKDEIKASVSDGYLTISAAKGLDKDEKEKDSGHYIRKERYAGACQRSFYVGEDIEQEDVKAEFKHGILKLFVPKKEAKKAVEENKYIAIEGRRNIEGATQQECCVAPFRIIVKFRFHASVCIPCPIPPLHRESVSDSIRFWSASILHVEEPPDRLFVKRARFLP